MCYNNLEDGFADGFADKPQEEEGSDATSPSIAARPSAVSKTAATGQV
jgi:hypothetical protein